MLSPKDFVARWGQDSDSLRTFAAESVKRLALSVQDQEFLLQAGLPEDAAPFLSFQSPASGELSTVAEQWDQADDFRRYRPIGSDGSGNPIALDDNQPGAVVCLDHENGFGRIFMNQSIGQLAESLLAYRQLVKDTQAEFGMDGFLDGKATVAGRTKLRQELMRIDPAAMRPDCFWPRELQVLDANAG